MIYAAKVAAEGGSVDISVLLLTALGGAVVAALAGLFGAWLQSRREHAKWVRERRYETYVEFAALVASVVMAKVGGVAPVAPATLQTNLQAIFILGPQSMVDSATRLVRAESAADGYDAALLAYQLEAAKILGIRR